MLNRIMMQDNLFNKNIEQQLHELNIEPSQNVWIGVEKELDKKKRRYFFVWWWLVPLLLIGTGLVLYFSTNINKHQSLTNKTKTLATQNDQQQINSNTQSINKLPETNDSVSSSISKNIETNSSATTKKDKYANSKTAKKITAPEIPDEQQKLKKKFSEKGKQKVTVAITNADTSTQNDNDLEIAENNSDKTLSDKIETVKEDLINNIVQQEKKELKKPEFTAQDSLQQLSSKNDKNKKGNHWEKQWSFAVGKTALTALSFSNKNTNTFYDPLGSGSSSGNLIETRTQYNFKDGIHLNAGIEIGRHLTKKITWFTGFYYSYNTIKVNTKISIDSLINSSQYIYTTISSKVNESNLYIHSISIPLLLKFSITPKIDISTGLYNNISFSSNWNTFSKVLGVQKKYLPILHLRPAYEVGKFSIGPFLNISLRQNALKENMINYGMLLKYSFKK